MTKLAFSLSVGERKIMEHFMVRQLTTKADTVKILSVRPFDELSLSKGDQLLVTRSPSEERTKERESWGFFSIGFEHDSRVVVQFE
jgi:hypothetical protein